MGLGRDYSGRGKVGSYLLIQFWLNFFACLRAQSLIKIQLVQALFLISSQANLTYVTTSEGPAPSKDNSQQNSDTNIHQQPHHLFTVQRWVYLNLIYPLRSTPSFAHLTGFQPHSIHLKRFSISSSSPQSFCQGEIFVNALRVRHCSSTCNCQNYVRDVEFTVERRCPKKIGIYSLQQLICVKEVYRLVSNSRLFLSNKVI